MRKSNETTTGANGRPVSPLNPALTVCAVKESNLQPTVYSRGETEYFRLFSPLFRGLTRGIIPENSAKGGNETATKRQLRVMA